MTTAQREAVRTKLLALLQADPDATNADLWDGSGAEVLGIARSTFASKYALAARTELGLARVHPARPLRMKTLKLPKRKLPPPAKWVPPPTLTRARPLTRAELREERRKWKARMRRKGIDVEIYRREVA